MFSGLMSRWNIPFECICSTDFITWYI